MKKWVSCGRYFCCVCGNDELVKLIPDSWVVQELKAVSSPATITVCQDGNMACTGTTDGWEVQVIRGFPTAMYTHSGKVMFALQLTSPKEVVVLVRKAYDSYVRIGIHYGIMLALHHECIGLHGVTLVCGNEIIILSAPSGTGKTTLANLLEKNCDAIIVNGDFALLHPTETGIIFEPTPFCGTSGRTLNHRLKVNRVVFLGQAKTDMWRKLGGREALQQFLTNAFLPTWDRKLLETVQENILKCISALEVNHYSFTPTREAAEAFSRHVMDG